MGRGKTSREGRKGHLRKEVVIDVAKCLSQVINKSKSNESLTEDEIKRYSDVVPKENRKYWYFTTHGVQPGSVPKGVNILEIKDGVSKNGMSGTFVCLDAVLNTSELKEYDMKEEVPVDESLTEGTDRITVKLSKDDLDGMPIEELHPDYYDLYIKDKGDHIEITGYETNIWNALHPYDLHWRTTKVNENLTEGAMTNGSYSLYNGWVKVPDKDSIPDEYPELEPEYSEWVSRSNTCSTIDDIDNFLDDVYKLRQQGLLATGEYGKENLIFKELRNNGVLQRLKDMKVKEQNKEMSLESLNEAGYSYDGFLDDDDLEDVRDMIYDDLGINVEVDFDEAADVPTLIFEPDDKDPDVLDELSEWCHDNLESALNYNYICTAMYSDPDYVKVEIKADIDESCGKELNEAEETDTRAQELANYLGVDVDEILAESGSPNLLGETVLDRPLGDLIDRNEIHCIKIKGLSHLVGTKLQLFFE